MPRFSDDTGPGYSPTRGRVLDEAPPQPPGMMRRPPASLMDMQQGTPPGASPGGLGADAGSPQIIALQGLAMFEQGTQLLAAAIPQLAPALTGLLANLRQVVPQAMADQVAGVDAAGAGQAGMTAGPGQPGMGAMAPSAPPPGPAGAPVGA